MPKYINDAAQSIKEYLHNPEKLELEIKDSESKSVNLHVPLKLEVVDIDNERSGINLVTSIGRESWIESIKYLLNSDISKILFKHRWTILKPFKGLNWITSDCPTIRLNYYKNGDYDFAGGWGNKGTELLLPLDPYHLLYTKVGEKPPQKGMILDEIQTKKINNIIANNALRIIISSRKIENIELIRKRVIDKEAFEFEKNEWSKWHSEQSKAEKEFL